MTRGRQIVLFAALACLLSSPTALAGQEVSSLGTAEPIEVDLTSRRVRFLNNGHFLTVDPELAVDPGGTADRHRMYVLHALLIDPETGRIAATYPALPGAALSGQPVARTVAEHPQLIARERPLSPDLAAVDMIAYWRAQGIDPALLEGLEVIDLEGAVVTAGLIDDHFHITSWSKKLPAPGEVFGFWADVGDPRYYTDVTDWSRVCTRDALWQIVADANRFLADQNRDRVYLHGFWYTQIDDPPASSTVAETHLFSPGASCSTRAYDPVYLLNRIGSGSGAPLEPPAEACTSDPSSWPPLSYEPSPAVLVHTSGQACWYNSALLEAYNANQEQVLASRFASVGLDSMVAPQATDEDEWSLTVAGGAAAAPDLFALAPSFPVDVVVTRSTPQETLHVPFLVTEVESSQGRLGARPVLPELSGTAFEDPFESLTLVPFFRPIAHCIPAATWNEAAQQAGETPDSGAIAYGSWDPRNPYTTNWYNGAERGLIEYFYDDSGQVWRPSGYAEHYVMRDALSSLVIDIPTVEQGIENRRRLASWAHRHGLTSVQDIMFYRRSTNTYEFEAYEGLSYDHDVAGERGFYSDVGLDSSVLTGDFGLRVGLYYYLENPSEVGRILDLAHDPSAGYDVERLRPPESHPEYPGWVRWLGWKIQLDGGTGARTLFTNAPMAKLRFDDRYDTVDEDGNTLAFLNHSFGLLTMTNHQEQVFSSRESAALYWLVRESDSAHPAHNPALTGDWTWLKNGVVDWLDLELDQVALREDLARLAHVELRVSSDPPLDEPAALAAKIGALIDQVEDGFTRTLAAIAKIWYEKSIRFDDPVALPDQVVSHCIGDGAVDLWVRAIQQLKLDVESFPDSWADLPSYWQEVIPATADLSVVERHFDNERFRVEHLLNVSARVFEQLHGPDGVDQTTSPAARNVVFSTQPSLLLLDGEAIKTVSFPYAQELWEIPLASDPDLWLGLPSRHRSHHHMPLPVFMAQDVPFTLNTDPPSIRDPRPALTVISAVTRSPVEIDPTRWLDQSGTEPELRPPDYLVGKVYSPLGLTAATPDNPMQITVEQALAAMSFWAAYVTGLEHEQGAIAGPSSSRDGSGWLADLVVWKANPLAIRGPNGTTLDQVGRVAAGQADDLRRDTVNAFISKFRPARTLVGGVEVFRSCVADSNTLCLQDERFEIEVAWRDFQGNSGRASAFELSNDSGYFTFFDPNNAEVFIKVLDTCSFADNYWVFDTHLSNVEYTITVTDTQTRQVRTIHNPLGYISPPVLGTDTLFRECGLGEGRGLAPAEWIDATELPPNADPIVQQSVDSAVIGPCVDDSVTACLAGGRFRAHARFADFQGNQGQARMQSLTGESAYATFFDDSNVELFMKVLDACSFDGRFWVFVAGLTNLPVELWVEDTETGKVWHSINPAGQPYATTLDTATFFTDCG